MTVAFEPIRSRRTFEEAVERIADAIRSGELPLGARLPAERVLAGQLQISRPTLREALALLASAGAVEVRPGARGGTFVTAETVPLDLVSERARLRAEEAAAVLEARRLFEPRVAQLAGLHAREEDLEAMERTIALQRAALRDRDHDGFIQLDMRFHLAIARATHNATIVGVMKVLLRELAVARDVAPRSARESQRAIELHELTYAAIRGGDAGAIEAAMDEHLAWLEAFWAHDGVRARRLASRGASDVASRRPKTQLPLRERSRGAAYAARRVRGE